MRKLAAGVLIFVALTACRDDKAATPPVVSPGQPGPGMPSPPGPGPYADLPLDALNGTI